MGKISTHQKRLSAQKSEQVPWFDFQKAKNWITGEEKKQTQTDENDDEKNKRRTKDPT